MEERLQGYADRINIALNSGNGGDIIAGIYSTLDDMKRNLSQLHNIYYTKEVFRFGEQDGKKCLNLVAGRGDMFECYINENQTEYPGLTIRFKEFKYSTENGTE